MFDNLYEMFNKPAEKRFPLWKIVAWLIWAVIVALVGYGMATAI